MILQKLASAVRRQDWFQVLVEVMIVVLGIFLGLQVQAWYEGRVAQQEEAVAITNLISDMEENINVIVRRLDNAREIDINSNHVLDVLERGVLKSEEVNQFERGLADFSKARSIESIGGAINDDVLSKIATPQIRTVITDFQESYVSTNFARDRVLKVIDASRMVMVTKAAILDGPRGGLITYYDFDNLKSDVEYRSALYNVYGSMWMNAALMTRLHRSVSLLLDALRQYQAGEPVDEVIFPIIIHDPSEIYDEQELP